jgi:hypothetical protein
MLGLQPADPKDPAILQALSPPSSAVAASLQASAGSED